MSLCYHSWFIQMRLLSTYLQFFACPRDHHFSVRLGIYNCSMVSVLEIRHGHCLSDFVGSSISENDRQRAVLAAAWMRRSVYVVFFCQCALFVGLVSFSYFVYSCVWYSNNNILLIRSNSCIRPPSHGPHRYPVL